MRDCCVKTLYLLAELVDVYFWVAKTGFFGASTARGGLFIGSSGCSSETFGFYPLLVKSNFYLHAESC